MNEKQTLENFVLELRRGALILAVMSQLQREHYGYSLMKTLADNGLEIDQGTLYPLLRRLEAQGLLVSSWRIEDPRPRRYYTLNDNGRRLLTKLKEEWDKLTNTINSLL